MEFLKQKNNTFLYNGENSTIGSPYEVLFNKGCYFVELYGASGRGSKSGYGGYSYGTLRIKTTTILYLYIGGEGIVNNQNKEMCLKGGWNGGGDACSFQYQSSGGGGTDIRTTKNDNYSNRIIIAGGGGGDGDGLDHSGNN